ncbi:hypothetical protein V518_2634 [Thermoanaerobacterium aotearoense SCUT27]|uniref:Uncharacterized protein n=3 Tax=Thermoanaerobacterium TaxID=28895 RepID=L0IQ69_THETR|nr:hypothetical protein Tsac_2766 [Thermoanaerobacterium saccharolyticum JW/SL-YS485]AGB20351.1 hypothetical protein Thethe_02797 [Thermoanaerobacterium thermosaccharolyticum M0795]ETO37229.1 hypothetical protein V518_2634 [Thermoanaerobacterium aotearoense SCUT27]
MQTVVRILIIAFFASLLFTMNDLIKQIYQPQQQVITTTIQQYPLPK